ncbi:DUF6427 family protein [Taibaiella koreensis]|uniref:DUF6427 family protein n=1 Tax=Taibaiella koreensis TaxID=1268548 RepID=UPI000E59BC77|nr:DUF6427 family protein [Taibaiella koreensis]
MLNLFRSYNPYSVIVLFLVAIFLKLAILIHPEMAFAAGHSQVVWLKLAGFLQAFLGNSAFLITFFALVNLFGQAIFLNRIANRHHLYPRATYLPALSYILVTSLFKDWNYLSAELVSNWLVLAMLSAMLQLYSPTDVRKQIFNIGCFISLTAMLVCPNILFVLLLLVALGVLRPFKASEWMVGLLGIITPFYFLTGILYLTDHLALLRQMIVIGFKLPGRLQHPEIVGTAAGLLLLMLLAGIWYLNYFMSRMLFQNKKWWWVVVAAFLVSLLAGAFTVAKGYHQWMAMLVPASFIIANVWFEERKKWVTTIFFYLFVAVVIFAQWFPGIPERVPAPEREKKPASTASHKISLNINYNRIHTI